MKDRLEVARGEGERAVSVAVRAAQGVLLMESFRVWTIIVFIYVINTHRTKYTQMSTCKAGNI